MRTRRIAIAATCLALGGAAVSGCKGRRGHSGLPGLPAPPPPTRTTLDRTEDLPGVVIKVTKIGTGSGPNGNLQPGDSLSVTFTVEKNDGTRLPLDELDSGSILFSGPSFNYQRVLERQTDLASRAILNADGSYTYTFADPIPATFQAPYNDTATFGAGDGELQGDPLLDGTYTVGIQAYKNYTVEGHSFRDPGVAVEDVLLGSAAMLEPREVVSNGNCNQCHVSVRAHGGTRLNVQYCVLCHTSGAEDKNVTSVANGTPDVTIDFRVMIHRIHNGPHLPSVLGVSTGNSGARVYDPAAAKKYEIVGFNNSVEDFSDHVHFPVFPNRDSPMPRDEGYSALTSTEQDLDDTIREGVTACFKCHGDPDGSDPAPAQGDVIYAQPTRRACGACHDDVDWTKDYTANGQTMPAQMDDSECADCHFPNKALAAQATLPQGITDLAPLAVEEAHVHPLLDSSFNPGLVLDLQSVKEAGTNDNDGVLDPGEKIQVTVAVTDANGTAIPTGDIDRISFAVSGPLQNRQVLVIRSSLPSGALTSLSQPYVFNLMEDVTLEYLGDSNGAATAYVTSRTGHWDSRGAPTTVYERTATTGGSDSLTSTATAPQNFVDVGVVTGFATDDYVVLDDGVANKEEYAQVALVDGNRLWFTAPLRHDHSIGAKVDEVTLTKRTVTTDYTLDEPSGTITTVGGQFAMGDAILVSYTGDYQVPQTYNPPLNDSPDLGETYGEWAGKPLVAGKYSVGLWARRTLPLMLYGESQSYRVVSRVGKLDVDFVAAGGQVPSPIISDPENCHRCHEDIRFHGRGRKGFDTCILCHGGAGNEDWPRYEGTPNAAPTTGVTIDFRQMLHRIHRGEDLPTQQLGLPLYTVVGFNGSSHTYDDIEFPAQPGGVLNCVVCHGNTRWTQPLPRDHPTQQSKPTLVWRVACNSCHDAPAHLAHMQLMTYTATGGESCMVCHGPGAYLDVAVVHQPR